MESAIGHGRQLIKLAARSRVKSLDRQAGGGREQVESGRRRDGVRPVSRAGPAQPASFFRPWGGLRNYDYMRSWGPVNWVRNLTTQGFEKEKKERLGLLFIFLWMIGKECNKKIFESKEISARVCWEADFCSVWGLSTSSFNYGSL
jgi:hypothetical protein